MNILSQGLGEDISPVGGGRHFFDYEAAIKDVISEVVEFESDVFRSGTKLSFSVGQGDARSVIFKNSGWG